MQQLFRTPRVHGQRSLACFGTGRRYVEGSFGGVTIGNVVDLWQAPYLGLNCKEPIVMNNQVSIKARNTSGDTLNMLSVDSSNNRQYGSNTTSATYSALYGGTNGVYINTNGSSRVQFTDSFFRPQVDNTYSNGTAANRWSVIYAGTGTINTSDERLKQQISYDLAPELKKRGQKSSFASINSMMR